MSQKFLGVILTLGTFPAGLPSCTGCLCAMRRGRRQQPHATGQANTAPPNGKPKRCAGATQIRQHHQDPNIKDRHKTYQVLT